MGHEAFFGKDQRVALQHHRDAVGLPAIEFTHPVEGVQLLLELQLLLLFLLSAQRHPLFVGLQSFYGGEGSPFGQSLERRQGEGLTLRGVGADAEDHGPLRRGLIAVAKPYKRDKLAVAVVRGVHSQEGAVVHAYIGPLLEGAVALAPVAVGDEVGEHFGGQPFRQRHVYAVGLKSQRAFACALAADAESVELVVPQPHRPRHLLYLLLQRMRRLNEIGVVEVGVVKGGVVPRLLRPRGVVREEEHSGKDDYSKPQETCPFFIS